MRRRVTIAISLLPFIVVLGWAAAGVALAGGGCHAEVEAIPTEDQVATGLYPYSCSLHPGMAGVVVVGSSVAANDADITPVSATVPATPATAADATLPIVAAAGLGILAGALVAGAVVSRRRPND